MAYSPQQYLSLLDLGPSDCPEEYSLIWNDKLQACVPSCVFPLNEGWQDDFSFYFGTLSGIISFLLCYFYCITALFRPIMVKFPNSNVVFQFFCLGISSIGRTLPLFFGRDYIFCDTLVTPGNTNWACVLCGVLTFYGVTSYILWFVIFHITITTRLYLIRLPKIAPYCFCLIAFGTWPLVAIICTTSLEYWTHVPGFAICGPFVESSFNYSMFISIFYLACLITTILVTLICIRLVRVKVSARVKWSIIIRKQLRLICYWCLYFFFVISFTINIIENERNSPTDEEIGFALTDYTFCVLLSSNPEDCKIRDNIDIPSFYSTLPYQLAINLYPIFTFIIMGSRLSLLLFWKEYIANAWKTKTFPIPYIPSFDPSKTASSGHMITTGVETSQGITGTNSLSIDSSRSENQAPQDEREKKLRKRINEI